MYYLGCCTQFFGPWSCRERWPFIRWWGRRFRLCVSLLFIVIVLFILNLIGNFIGDDTLACGSGRTQQHTSWTRNTLQNSEDSDDFFARIYERSRSWMWRARVRFDWKDGTYHCKAYLLPLFSPCGPSGHVSDFEDSEMLDMCHSESLIWVPLLENFFFSKITISPTNM